MKLVEGCNTFPENDRENALRFFQILLNVHERSVSTKKVGSNLIDFYSSSFKVDKLILNLSELVWLDTVALQTVKTRLRSNQWAVVLGDKSRGCLALVKGPQGKEYITALVLNPAKFISFNQLIDHLSAYIPKRIIFESVLRRVDFALDLKSSIGRLEIIKYQE